ncbi:MAG: nicotinamide mononucleotide transporter family protein [Oscillospiraceae bacterium]|jgi:nicotinamide riboside transporter PnuC|nr:nicotinamide mononucleotide transporter family protein [Oscillospiraceae bacterium]
MDNFDYTWITAAISIIASYLNIKKKVACFYLWKITAIFHTIIDIKNQQYGRAFLDVFLLIINIYGIIVWTKDEKQKIIKTK